MLRFYNTLSRKKEAFKPIDASNVRMYVCGPTVYDFAHIGNARPIIVFDVLFRLLRQAYGAEHVTYVRNITDVDDKINARAARDFADLPLNEAIAKVTADTTRQFHEDIAKLGVLEPTFEPRATEFIGEMREMIETLVAKGNAYVAEGHVLFDVASMPEYGKLSGRSVDEMIAGARVEVAPYKKSPMDFVLWKPSSGGEPGWPSPCGIDGIGRPGWHIECSAMSKAHLGKVFDIHGGGIDLTFPHHENEIAQSCCAHKDDSNPNKKSEMARVWMHNGFLQVEGAKMSKSEGNFLTIDELLDRYGGEVLRMTMLKTHYRQPIDWTVRSMRESSRELTRWRGLVGEIESSELAPDDTVFKALADDMNTPAAIKRLHELKNEGNLEQLRSSLSFLSFSLKKERIQGLRHQFLHAEPGKFNISGFPAGAKIHHSGLSAETGNYKLSGNPVGSSTTSTLPSADGDSELSKLKKKVNELCELRKAARERKDFVEADRIRDELAEMDVVVKDNPDGSCSWEFKS
ncbi:MAG: cysteine--tRNA ligase [Hyphomicrobiales bacterium]